jgi:hypothetical protein
MKLNPPSYLLSGVFLFKKPDRQQQETETHEQSQGKLIRRI